MTRLKSVVADAQEVDRAAKLIRMGARLQLLEAEVSLSRERLLRLYKEIHRKSPPKGMLPFSTDWFMAWQPNVHSSLFLGIYEFLQKTSDLSQVDTLIKAYPLYLEHVSMNDIEPVLSITRAWRLVKFVDAGMLCTASCVICKGNFVAHAGDLHRDYHCGLCHMPARAGKTARNVAESLLARVA